MSVRLRGSVSVITGAASGIGRATALALAVRGGHLALTDRDADRLAATAAAARRHGVRVTTHVMDVTDGEAVAALPQQVVDAHGRVTVLVNNAGRTLVGRFDEVSLPEFRALVDVNLDAVVSHTHAFLPALSRQPAARIVMVSSLFGLVAPAGQVAYATTKFAVRGFGEALRHELSDSTVGVTVVHPGGVATNISRHAPVARGADTASAHASAAAFDEQFLRTPPAAAARDIVRAIERGRPRVLIGGDARIGDTLARLLPGRYWSVLGGAVARAADRS